MTAKNRRFISLLLSLLLVISGPVLAVSQMASSEGDLAKADCGSMVMEENEGASHLSDRGTDCFTNADMACPSTGGVNQCGFNFAILLPDSTGLTGIGSQPVLIGHLTIYQDPFLSLSTPPPLHHS